MHLKSISYINTFICKYSHYRKSHTAPGTATIVRIYPQRRNSLHLKPIKNIYINTFFALLHIKFWLWIKYQKSVFVFLMFYVILREQSIEWLGFFVQKIFFIVISFLYLRIFFLILHLFFREVYICVHPYATLLCLWNVHR